ncbi:MAG TPA: hypothetical protein VFB96_17945 [Pirellulaceae bacterium]|jgi:hypothetical protein|nr:hypothetical protein [Pirellulaceae bacterium]
MSYAPNPFRDPSEKTAPPSRAALLERVRGPAWALMITSGIWIVALLVAAAFSLGLLATGMAAQMRPPPGMTKETQIVIRLLFGVVLMATSALTIFGAYCLMTLKHRALAVTAIILSLVPCTSACYVVGIGIGVWALVVILQPEVWAAFEESESIAP